MIDPNETDEDKRKRLQIVAFRRGYITGAQGALLDPCFIEHERADIRSAYERGFRKGAVAVFLAATEEAERLGYDARVSILRGGA